MAAQREIEAMGRGDVSSVARSILLTPEAKTLIEAAAASAPPEFVRDYPTPELMAAFVFCGAQHIEGFRINSTRFEQPDRAIHSLTYKFASEPEWRIEEVIFVRDSDEWRRVVTAGLAERVAAIIGTRRRSRNRAATAARRR